MTTPGTFNDPHFGSEDIKEPQVRQAVEEGHDADIPSRVGIFEDKDPEKQTYSASSATDEHEEVKETDPNIVDWEQPANEDPANPMNWSSGRKWLNIGIVSYICFIT
jgi:hypothetical protein